jgi:hypothetical protein
VDGRRLGDDGGGVCGVSFSSPSVAPGEGWPILPCPARWGWVCSQRDSVPLAGHAASCVVVLWSMRTCDGSRVVELIVLVKLSSVRNHNCNGMSGSGRLVPVYMGRDVARRIIANVKSLDCAMRECLINVLSV